MPFRGLRSPGIGDLDPKESGGGKEDPLAQKKIGGTKETLREMKSLKKKREKHIHEGETILVVGNHGPKKM